MSLLTASNSIADVVGQLLTDDIPFRFSAYDGSSVGPEDAEYGMELLNERGLRYLLTAPGDLGLARAYVSGDLTLPGTHPGDPYPALVAIKGDPDSLRFRVPTPADLLGLVRSLGLASLKPPPIPAEEHVPRWRRIVEGMRCLAAFRGKGS